MKRRVLFLTTTIPFPPTTGGEHASAAFVTGLAAHAEEVVVVGYMRPERRGKPLALPPGITAQIIDYRPVESRTALIRAAWWAGIALLSGRAGGVVKYTSTAGRRLVQRLLAEKRFDMIVVDHVQMLWLVPLLKRLAPDQGFVLATQNVESDLYATRARNGHKGSWFRRREAKLVTRLESKGLAEARSVWALTLEDARLVESLGAGGRVRQFDIFPMGSALPSDEVSAIRFDVGMIGTWTWPETQQGLDWFLKGVLPMFPKEFRVGVAGRMGSTEQGADSRVTFLGFVDSAQQFLASCRVIAVPAIGGGGVQVKTLDALRTGKPVVVTRDGIRGIGSVPPWARVVESPEDFANAIQEESRSHRGGFPFRDKAKTWMEARRASFEAQLREAMDEALTWTRAG